MTEDVKQARRIGRAALVARSRTFFTRRRLAVGGAVSLPVGIAVVPPLLAIFGGSAVEAGQEADGWVDVSAIVLIGFGAGMLTLSICTLFWRRRDVPRRSKPPMKDVLLSERYAASVEEAQTRGIPPDEAHTRAENTLGQGERERIIVALDDRVARQAVGAIVLSLPTLGLIPAMLGISLLEGNVWGAVIGALFLAQVRVLNFRFWESWGRALQVRDRLAQL
jgi:hypothetical protein